MRLESIKLIVDTYKSIEANVAKEFESTIHPSHIDIPVDIETDGNKIKVYFNLGMYESKTSRALSEELANQISYCYDVSLTTTDRYAELVLTYEQ